MLAPPSPPASHASCPRRRRGPPVAPSLPAASAAAAAAVEAPPLSGADFVRPHLRRLAAYTPIVPFEVLSARLGRAPADIVKLDANENPYGPPPGALGC